MPETSPENKPTVAVDDQELLKDEQPEPARTPLERLIRSIKKASGATRPSTSQGQKELGKDRSKSLFLVAGSAIAALLFFLIYFSSPQKPNHARTATHRGQPDLGQRTTPGQEQKQPGSIVPVLAADMASQQNVRTGQVTPDDISRLSHVSPQTAIVSSSATAKTLVSPETKNQTDPQYTLGHIDFSDPELQRRYAQGGHGPYVAEAAPPPLVSSLNAEADFKKPSLVFVSSQNSTSPNLTATGSRGENDMVKAAALATEEPSLGSVLPAGTRLVARLQSPASTAVAASVVAAIEYNYERDGEIVVPAGSKAVGKLEQANSSGYVTLHFNRIEFQDGTAEKMDGTSMGLDFEPVKGLVSGKKRGSRFLVQTLTGVGTVAAYAVGANNLNGPLSNGALLRERLADNVAIAGENEMDQVAFNQNILVTVPGNTRFYIVFHETPNSSGESAPLRRANSPAAPAYAGEAVPNLQELRQLLQLRQELSQLYQQGSNETTAPGNSQPQ